MINGTGGIVILVMFIVVLVLGGTLMSYWADWRDRKEEQKKLEQELMQQEREKPEETRRAA